MNLLSHALLTPPFPDEPGVLVGNVVADWIKGRARLEMPEAVQKGMWLHGRIDVFMDTHELMGQCSALLSERWGRYAEVLVDIFFDHCLAARWELYSALPRRDFVAGTYAVLRGHLPVLPERAHYAVCALIADDWFNTYATLEGIALALSRLSARLRHGVELAPAVDDLRTHADFFHAAYAAFFPQVRGHVQGVSAAGLKLVTPASTLGE